MRRFSYALVYAVYVAALTYAVGAGATYNGLLLPQLRLLGMSGLVLLAVGWLVMHWRGGWHWHRTPLDIAVLCWFAAFALSFVANADSWRRILIGLWFVFLYIGLWYLAYDLLANRVLNRAQLVDGLLIVGLLVTLLGFIQLRGWFTLDLPRILAGLAPLELPRPVSTLGNPNTLGAFLVMLIPLVIGRAFSLSGARRIVLIVYALVAVLLLFLTFSRGGWVGFFVAIVVFGGLLLHSLGLLSTERFSVWWASRSRLVRAELSTTALLGALLLLAAGLLLVRSLGQGGRSVDLRTYIYEDALQLIAEQPLAGHGLFTFGRGLSRLESSPPYQPHSHAHNLPLHVGAELGLVGIVALAVTIYWILRAVAKNIQHAAGEAQPLVVAGAAAFVGFAIHHLIDMPLMVPVIALVALFVLLVAAFPVLNPVRIVGWQVPLRSILFAGGWLVLLLTGLWSVTQYIRYEAALTYAATTSEYRAAADRLQPVINADPNLAVYHVQQGYLYGLAAAAGDADALPLAIDAYQRYVALEPDYAFAWANLAALYWQAGEQALAVEAMERAVALAPEAWQFAFGLGRYYETLGDEAAARAAYEASASLNPDSVLLPEWDETPLRREIAAGADVSPLAETVRRLAAGDVLAAQQTWSDSPASETESAVRYVIDALLALAGDDPDSAAALLDAAAQRAESVEDRAWLALGQARLAEFNGDDALARTELARVRAAFELGPLDRDDPWTVNIHYIQFLRTAIPRQYLPGVFYPQGNPALRHLLHNGG